jgi:RNA polymerase sigma-70 factor (ECF subfamily)
MTDLADRLYERVLILRCQAGDEAAFAELVGRYGPRLRYYLRKMLGAAHAAEDAGQDVWLAVFRGLPRLADPAAFPAWLFRVARNRAYGELRRRRPAPRPLDEAGQGPGAAEDRDDFPAEASALIHAGLDRLAPEHREVLVLRFLEAMTYDEIAAVVGVPPGTVRSRIHYAKRALRRVLGEARVHE